jgi:hypothetical protein
VTTQDLRTTIQLAGQALPGDVASGRVDEPPTARSCVLGLAWITCPPLLRPRIGLWNVMHVDEQYDPGFLDLLAGHVSNMTLLVP